jgi:hypothetical protein
MVGWMDGSSFSFFFLIYHIGFLLFSLLRNCIGLFLYSKWIQPVGLISTKDAGANVTPLGGGGL